MLERTAQQQEEPVPLLLGAGRRILAEGMEPVAGWTEAGSPHIAQALVFPSWLLEPSASRGIVYACNLPAAAHGESDICTPRGLDAATPQAGAIARPAEGAFLAASLPGGRVPVITAEGGRGTVHFRWACVSAQPFIGAVWRCFLKLGGEGLWKAAPHDYVFEAAGGSLVNRVTDFTITLGERTFTIAHPGGMLTCLPSRSGLVKVTRLAADGWGRRELEGLALHPDRAVVARFSDGTQAQIAIAAPAHAPSAIAA